MADEQQDYDIKQNATFLYLKYMGDAFASNTDELQSIKKFYLENKNNPKFSAQIKLAEMIRELTTLKSFDSNIDYAAKYTQLQEQLDVVARSELKKGQRNPAFDYIFKAMYENDNKIHSEIYEKVIEPNNRTSMTSEDVNNNIKKVTSNPGKVFNISHPDNPLNAFFSAMLGVGYNPLKKNNVPYVAFDSDELQSDQKCLRIGSQVQGAGEVNPTFKRYLLAKAHEDKDNTNEKGKGNYNYVYINLLKRPQEHQSPSEKTGVAYLLDKFVRFSEGKKALALENDLNKPEFKTACITLPADGEFFNGDFSLSTGKSTDGLTTNLEELQKELYESIRDNKNDFYMPDEVKAALFGDNMKEVVEQLYLTALQKTVDPNIQQKDLKGLEITPQNRNALLFQFVKGELSNKIIDDLNPKAYNMSCKDAIDRGGIHTLYHHLNKRFDQNNPMSEAEFKKYMDAPAMIVKYRTLNDNRTLLWNTLKHRNENDPKFAKSHPWVKDWVAKNDPAIKHEKAASYRMRSFSLSHFTTNLRKSLVKGLMNGLKPSLTSVVNRRHSAPGKLESMPNAQNAPQTELSKSNVRPQNVQPQPAAQGALISQLTKLIDPGSSPRPIPHRLSNPDPPQALNQDIHQHEQKGKAMNTRLLSKVLPSTPNSELLNHTGNDSPAVTSDVQAQALLRSVETIQQASVEHKKSEPSPVFNGSLAGNTRTLVSLFESKCVQDGKTPISTEPKSPDPDGSKRRMSKK
ncbi:MAG: hypothetical protein HYX61_00090 [Gammaproteobacteria bacterium]|jgi:hypothetical protein|nr:hypothetical protein [Gammaproteobacteria bacterium]